MHASIIAWCLDEKVKTISPDSSNSLMSIIEGEKGEETIVLPVVALDILSYSNQLKEKKEKELQILPNMFRDGLVDVMLNINMIHISPFECTPALFNVAQSCLKQGGFLCTYGPYKVNGQMLEGNIQFDLSLKARDPSWGIRDIEEVVTIAESYGMYLQDTVEMPANNLSLFFVKK